jgi:hypothetical protein
LQYEVGIKKLQFENTHEPLPSLAIRCSEMRQMNAFAKNTFIQSKVDIEVHVKHAGRQTT